MMKFYPNWHTTQYATCTMSKMQIDKVQHVKYRQQYRYWQVTVATANQTDKRTPPSPPLVLGGPSDKSPVNADRLAHQVLTVEPFHGCLGLFVCFILHQCVSLGMVTSTSCELLHIYSFSVLEFGILQFNNTAQKTGLLITQLSNNILQVVVSAGPLQQSVWDHKANTF